MSEPSPAVNLACFDAATPVELDPRTWMANLAALRAEEPDFAAALERSPLPAHWRSVQALDGFTTFRTESRGATAAWLAGTAAPLTRASGLLTGLQTGEQNLTLPALGAGAELYLLLERLPVHQAVYVLEAELVAVAAVLRTLDLAAPIASGRCILVPPGEELAFLERHLAAHPGLLPPGLLIRLPPVPADRVEQVRATCQQAAQKTHATRNQRLRQLASTAPPATAPGDVPRLAIVALEPAADSLRVSVSLAQAGQTSGWPVVECALRGPRDVHVLQHAESLAAFQPNLTVCVNHARARLPVPLPGTVCEWFLDARQVPDQLPEDDVLRLAASPRVYAALRTAAPRGARLAEWYWACNPVEPPGGQVRADTLLLVADLPDDDPAACGIEQPSHRQLWRELRRLAAQRWEAQQTVQPEALLRQAERAAGLRLGDSSVRALLLRALEVVLIPRVMLEKIVQTLGPELRLLTVGTGWQRWPDKEIEPFAPSVFALGEEAERLCPPAAIFAGAPDPLTPALLHAAARGWPLLIHDAGRRTLRAALGGMLHPRQDYLPFGGPRELRAAVQACRDDPPAAVGRATRLRAHLCRHHTYQHRLQELKTLVHTPRPKR